MPPRFHVEIPLAGGREIELPPRAVRHVQVLRLQPGEDIVLFDGQGGQWSARLTRMGRQAACARIETFDDVERELAQPVTVALGMPANDRMDTLIEKAAELGVAAVQPLVTERSVLRVAGERAERKSSHWRAVAAAACEQCGRNRVPAIGAPVRLGDWLAGLGAAGPGASRWLLSPRTDAAALPRGLAAPAWLLSGPEGGLTDDEQADARRAGFVDATLGPRVLRADTAPLAALAVLGVPSP